MSAPAPAGTTATATAGREVRALLFDLDGTLVDTRAANLAAYAQALAEAGHPVEPAALAATWGRDARDFIPDLVPGIAPEQVDAVRARKAAVYGGHLGGARPNTALVGWLRAVAGGHATALVTTAKRANAAEVLAAHDLAGLFDVVVTGDDVQRGKPDPQAYTTALAALGAGAGEALAFEDSQTGVDAALAAGLAVLRVPAF